MLILSSAVVLGACGTGKVPVFEREKAVEVTGRQGVCCEGDSYWISGSKTLARYDSNWNLVLLNEDPFEGYEIEVNHIGDIDVYNNELYIGAEYFMDGVGTNIQVAVYDADTLKLKRTFPFVPESGQLECSGITVDPDTKTVWMCSWVGGDSGIYLYAYDLETGTYKGKFLMIKRKGNPCIDTWALPGGFAEPKESPEDTAIREVKEETGISLTPEVLKQIATVVPDDPRSSIPNFWQLDVTFIAQIPDEVEITATAGDDAAQVAWFPLDQGFVDTLKTVKDIDQPWAPGWCTRVAVHHADIIRNGMKYIF